MVGGLPRDSVESEARALAVSLSNARGPCHFELVREYSARVHPRRGREHDWHDRQAGVSERSIRCGACASVHRERPGRATARRSVRQGRRRPDAGGADGPRGPAARARAARHTPGACVAARSRHGAEVARSRARRVRARRGGTAEHRARSELRAERVGLSVLLATRRHAGRRSGYADRQRGRCAVLRHGNGLGALPRRIRLSRFQWNDRAGTLDLGSEEQILDVPVDRGICCHVGGDIVFDADGNLYLSTGDDTNPFDSDGYTPIDEREGRNPAFDAQRTAANTNDLRGKILRITPPKAAATRSLRTTCSPRAPRARGPRSTRWACATRSGSSTTSRRTSCTWPTTRRTRSSRTRSADRPATASGWSSLSRPTTAGRTARRPSSPTSTTPSPPARRASDLTATTRSTSPPTTPG